MGGDRGVNNLGDAWRSNEGQCSHRRMVKRHILNTTTQAGLPLWSRPGWQHELVGQSFDLDAAFGEAALLDDQGKDAPAPSAEAAGSEARLLLLMLFLVECVPLSQRNSDVSHYSCSSWLLYSCKFCDPSQFLLQAPGYRPSVPR